MSSRRHLHLWASTALLSLVLTPWPALAQETDEPLLPPAEAEADGKAPTELDPLTVTATKMPREQGEVPASIDVIDQEQLDRKQPLTIGDALNDLPGVEIEGGPKGSDSQPNIRGMGSTGWGTNRVLMTIDGARQNIGSGHGGTMFVDPEMIKRIEVMKGAGSTLYGSGAIGGVIALETKDAEDFLDDGDTIGFRAKAGFHSVNDEPSLSGIVALRPIDEVDFIGSAVWRDSQDYEGGSGLNIDHTEVDILSGLAKLGISPAEGHRIELSGLLYSNNEDIEATDVDNLNTIYDADHEIDKSTATLSYAFDSPDTDLINLKATVYRDDTDVKDDGEGYDRVTTTELTTTGFDLFNTFEFDSTAIHHAITFGTEYYHDTGKGRVDGEKRAQFPDATQDVVGIYAQYELELFEQISVTPGVRWDYYKSQPSGDFSDQSDDRISPKIAVDWHTLDWLSLYASYAEGYRAPSVTELYIGGTHFNIFPGANNVFVPNPDLKPETAKTWEGGLRLNFDDVMLPDDGIRFHAAYYTTKAKDFIDGDVVMDFIPPMVFTTTPVNVPRAEIDGIEVTLSYDSDYVFFNGGYSRVRGTNKTDDEPLLSIPADKLMLVVGGKLPAWDVSFGVSNEFAWAQNRTPEDALGTDGYHVVGLFAGWAPEEGVLKGFRVDAGIDNVFDNSYLRYLAEEEAPGRDYRVAISYGMSF
nr:TonB-dependent hemoglobin/transferrin/lactoferrin family receptor [uncultured Dongia sp.]